jgi:uncharacterized protein YdhG (YjbR/CyaY superfamily)
MKMSNWLCPLCNRAFKKVNQHHFCVAITTIDDYIKSSPEKHHKTLYKICEIIREEMPNCTEKLYWKMPSFWQNDTVIYFAVRKEYFSLFPSSETINAFSDNITLSNNKKAMLFPWDKPISYDLIRKIVKHTIGV